jgi:hypothetical protein
VEKKCFLLSFSTKKLFQNTPFSVSPVSKNIFIILCSFTKFNSTIGLWGEVIVQFDFTVAYQNYSPHISNSPEYVILPF